MDRKVTITFDEEAGKCVAVGDGVDVSPKFWHDSTRQETYKHQLVNGEVTVINADGSETLYAEGCQLVEQSGMLIHAMSKPDYEKFTGRPGSGNES